ncbi:bactofilin family protein [Modicisalibacter coralii]|uniref:bactofilin family protein n=1 Tax=Modicisalibacter coralii TaxID=2304602 RepID=UPI00100BBDE6|nr:polymer-forming cytoskeletal protein [Halomonas coralii]
MPMEVSGWLILLGLIGVLLILLDGRRRQAHHDATRPSASTGGSHGGARPATLPAISAASSPETSVMLPEPPGTLVGASLRVRGRILADEPVTVCGHVAGDIEATGQRVTVAAGGEVQEGIAARHVVVDGRVSGRLQAIRQVELLSCAVVEGTIVSDRLSCQAGARLRAEVKSPN